ncbi:MAG: coenzyme F420-0:L-glutamate ligase [Candidatus Dormibacteria bacterium]|jgi:coenzyme F420-0:L-glutamate ligase/coenzyme F420-1:gamma-L-glutamate ligase
MTEEPCAGVELRGIEGLPEVASGDDLGRLIAERAAPLRSGDIVVVAQKVVSKAEGMLRSLGSVAPGARAQELAERLQADPRMVQVVLDESVRVVRAERVLIVETRQGFVCANAGVDRSNVPGADIVCLLPVDCDRSAERLRRRIAEVTGAEVGVVISDTFGRPWRVGLCNVALGVAGIPSTVDYRGSPDDFGMPLQATLVAVADEIAAAAEMVMGKTRRIPAVVVRGLDLKGEPGSGRELVRTADTDLFR